MNMRFLLLLEASAMDYVFETQDRVPGSPDTSPEEQAFKVSLGVWRIRAPDTEALL